MQEHSLEVELYHIKNISQKDLTQVLTQSEQGFEAILKNIKKNTIENSKKLKLMKDFSFLTAISFLQCNSEFLRTPLIIDNQKVLIGYSSDEIRKFLPRNFRTYTRYAVYSPKKRD